MKFQNIAMSENHADLFNCVNKNLWHGNHEKSIQRLDELLGMELIPTNKKKRHFFKQIFTSNLSESTVNTVINDRQKGKQKMLWSRQGAHNILQIRSSVFSKSWDNDWAKVEAELYHLAA